MLKQHPSTQPCSLSGRGQTGFYHRIVSCLLLSPIIFFSGLTAAMAQADTSAIGPLIGTEKTDSSDYFLSTDSNTHDIGAALSSGYVITKQELRHIPPSIITNYKSKKEFAYANDPAYWQQEKPQNLHLDTYWQLFKIACGAFLIYGIYRLTKENFSGVFGRKARQPKNMGDLMSDEDQLSADDLEKRLAAAVSTGDFRTAVRLHYLKLLKGLRQRGLIPVGRLATNRAWASAFSNPTQVRQFRSLASAYEYVVYGGFEPSENQFAELQQKFTEFTQNLQS